MVYLWLTLLMLLLVCGWLLTLFALPGNWVMVVATALFAWLVPDADQLGIGWVLVAIMAALATLGELLEFAAGALGAARVGGSKRGAILAIFGSMLGGLAGAAIGTPIPIVGTVVAAVLGAGLGALAGAMLGETWKGQSLEQSWQVGQGAFWGRLLGTFAKTTIGSVMVVVPLVPPMYQAIIALTR